VKISKLSLALVILCFHFALVFFASAVQAQDKEAITLGHTERFHSKILNETRTLEIHLPEGFSNSEERHPLVIVLDGGDLYRYTVGFLDMLAPNYFPSMVVVGIPNTDRGRDLDVGEGEDTGSASFRLFVEKELLPYLAETYRASGYRTLMGHSLAGLFTLHMALDQPQLFDAYIATSPSLAYEAGQATIRDDLEKLDNDSLSGRYLYFCAGGEEGEELLLQVKALDREFTKRELVGFSWASDVFDQEGHFPTKGFYQGMRRIFAGWAPPREWFFTGTLEELQKHYQLLGARYDMSVKPPSDMIWSLRSRLERMEMVDEHLAATDYHVEQYPANTATKYQSQANRVEVNSRDPGLEKPATHHCWLYC